jgi:uncharacterized protein
MSSVVTPQVVLGELPHWGEEALAAFAEEVGSPESRFPCTFAVTALRRGDLRYAFVEDAMYEEAWEPLVEILTGYMPMAREIGRETSRIVFFRPEERSLEIGRYQAAFWRLLQFLHDRDPQPWPRQIPRELDSEYWEFCFAGEPTFVVCNTPSHRRRASRRSRGMLVAFQPRWVFDGLEIHTKKGRLARDKIRRRLCDYDGMPPYPALGPYGDPDYREWPQYFLPDTNERAAHSCPLQVRAKGADGLSEVASVDEGAIDRGSPGRVVTGPREERSRPTRPVRLHRNESPLGAPWPAVARLGASAGQLHEYPSGAFEYATRAVAEHLGLASRQILLTTGVDEATDLLLLQATGRAHVVSPGFDGYVDRAEALGKATVTHRLTTDFRLPATAISRVAAGDVAFLASPNNPTGHRFENEEILSLSEGGAHLMLDETYADFASDATGLRLLDGCPRLVVFRSFSKAYGLAGLRIGCLLGDEDLIAQLATRKPFYSVDCLALLEEAPEFPGKVAAVTRRHRRELVKRLTDAPLIGTVRDTEANFVLARLTDEMSSAEVTRLLADRHGILVAPTDKLGLPGCLRISVGRGSADTEALVAALTAIFEQNPQRPSDGRHRNGHS